LIFETHAPPPPFDAHIESIFHFKAFQPDHSIERVVPTGHTFVIFELDGFTRHTYDNETLVPVADFQHCWISGVHRNHLSISAHQDSEMFVIQFKPHGARPFLHRSLHELSDRVVGANTLPQLDLLTLRNRIADATSVAEKFDEADAWLAKRYRSELAAPGEFVALVEKLQSQPAVKLNDAAQTVGSSQKHLIHQFKKYVGITPKQYQRILRFNDVFAQMQGDQFVSWSDIAYRCGYSDQSHFIREFKTFSGFNPESFLKEEFDDDAENFFPLDRNG